MVFDACSLPQNVRINSCTIPLTARLNEIFSFLTFLVFQQVLIFISAITSLILALCQPPQLRLMTLLAQPWAIALWSGKACHPLPLLRHARALVTSLDSLLASLAFVSSLTERQAWLSLDASILQAHCGSALLERLPFNLFLPAFTSSFHFIQWLRRIALCISGKCPPFI